ncbi:hypothetical protein Pla22_34790 [Rubripirellula amarantea]|uniref:Uncharacterized protein n=1 Tax=Rubripirellula amarantea TaxID=2527999 RepID=A0A5C5WIT3_9BACT|nr:hypothetical protein Pla22_34790 [Rubripirellula amarantea]
MPHPVSGSDLPVAVTAGMDEVDSPAALAPLVASSDSTLGAVIPSSYLVGAQKPLEILFP